MHYMYCARVYHAFVNLVMRVLLYYSSYFVCLMCLLHLIVSVSLLQRADIREMRGWGIRPSPRIYYNNTSINQFTMIEANGRAYRHCEQMSIPAPCWDFQQVMSLRSAVSLWTTGTGRMDKHQASSGKLKYKIRIHQYQYPRTFLILRGEKS